MDALREATEKLKQRRKKKSKKDKMSHKIAREKWTLIDDDGQETELINLSYTVGQGTGSDIRIQDDSVDQTHAFINFNEESFCFQVTDLNSDTGTYVNESRIPSQQPVPLKVKDTLRFGDSRRSLRVESSMSDRLGVSREECVEVSAMQHQQSPAAATSHLQQQQQQHLKENRKDNTATTQTHQHTGLVGKPVSMPPGSVSRSPATPRRSRHRNASQGESSAGKVMENGGHAEKQEVKPVWASRQEASHIMAECPGCIAEQEIRHTCGGQEEGSLPPHSVAHTHPVTSPRSTHPPPPQTWEDPPHYHHPAYPQLDYITSYPNQRTEDYLYPPTSPSGFSPAAPAPHHFSPTERRSHEASESQLKRSKSAQFQYEPQGFVPYSNLRDPYHYAQYPAGSYNPAHSYHHGHPPPPPPSHLHGLGYYPPPHGQSTRPPHPHQSMFSHYPSKAMYHGCKTCSSFMAEYGQVPREHLHYHAVANTQELSQEDPQFPPPLPRQPPPPGAEPTSNSNNIQDTSPSDQGYGSQTEKVESLESSTAMSASDRCEASSVSDNRVMEGSGEASCDTEVSGGSGVSFVSTLSTKVTSLRTTEVEEEKGAQCTKEATGAELLNNTDVDIIPERDTNHSSQVSTSGTGEGENQGILKSGLATELIKPVSLDLSQSEPAPHQTGSVVLRTANPTHTPPERDTGPHSPAAAPVAAPRELPREKKKEAGVREAEENEAEEADVSRGDASASTGSIVDGAGSSRPGLHLMKFSSVDVSEVLEGKTSLSDWRPRREDTFVKSESKLQETQSMSSINNKTEKLIKTSDITATDIDSSSSEIVCDNDNTSVPVIPTSSSVKASEPVALSHTNASEAVISTASTKASENVPPTKPSEPSPPAKKGSSMAFTIDLGNDAPVPPSSMAATAFTVDIGMEEVSPGNKKLTHSDSLSNFLPQKLRKSFKDRASKAKSEKEEKQANEVPGTENDSHPQPSPLTKRRAGGGGNKPGRPRTGYHSDGTHSNMSSDNEEFSIHSERTSASRKSLPPRPTQSHPRPRHRPKPESSHTRTTRTLEGMSVEKKLEQRLLRSKSVGFSKASSIDDYLNSMEQCDDGRANPTLTTTKQEEEVNPPPEYVLYKEAKHYDSMIKSKSGTRGKKEDSGSAGKKPRVNTTSRSLNVPRSNVADEDNISETGTYTIENTDKDVQSARQSIDSIFNVPDRLESLRMRGSGYVAPRQQPRLPVDNSSNTSARVPRDGDINGNFQQTETERNKAPAYAGDREFTTDQEKSSFYVTAVAPNSSMIKHFNTDTHRELAQSPDIQPPLQTHASSTSPHSQGRQRPRRKLPTPPVRANPGDSSPRTPRSAAAATEVVDIDSPGRHRGSVTYNNDEGGSCFTISFDAPQKHEAPVTSGRDEEEEGEVSVVSSMFSQGLGSRVLPSNPYSDTGPVAPDSARSRGSLGSDILLKDSEQVRQEPWVLESQQAAQYVRKDSLDDEESEPSRYSPVTKQELALDVGRDSDSDTSSTNAVVDESLPKHGKGGAALQGSHSKGHRTQESYKGKPYSMKDRVLGLKGKTSKRLSSSSADFDQFGGTDDSENESSSFASTGTDYSNIVQSSPKFQRQGSTGKGSIANTRTNRTFALRRGVADGSDSESARPETARSAKAEKTTPRTRSRPSSAKESSRKDASHGTKSMPKTRDNAKQGSARESKDSSLTRKDGGRFSLRGSKSTAPLSTTKGSDSKSKKKPDLATPRSGRLSSGSLSASANIPKSSSQSQTPGKTKKAADDYQAWQRRNKYDPRKAVADAKAKEKRARSVGNTPEFSDSRPRGETIDSVSSEETHLDEITKLSSAVANDLNLMTSQAKQESETYVEEYSEVRSSAFKSVTSSSSVSNGSAFKSPVKNTSSPLYSPVPVKGHTSTQYDPVLVSSIQQMSSQLKCQVHRIMDRLSEERGVDSAPVEDLLGDSVEEASPELTSTVSNLRNTELLLRVLERDLFSESEEVSLQESNRIRDEAGFRPIPQTAHSREPVSKGKKPAASGAKKSSRVARTSNKQETRVNYPSAEYY